MSAPKGETPCNSQNGNGRAAHGDPGYGRRNRSVERDRTRLRLRLARPGFHVFAGVRKEDDARDLEGAVPEGRIKPLLLDVTDADGLDSAAETLEEAAGGRGSPGWSTTPAYTLGRRDSVDTPTAIAVFAEQFVPDGSPPREWAERLYNVRRWTPMPSGRHFASTEEPDLLARDIAAFFADP